MRGITRGQFFGVAHDQLNGAARIAGEKVGNGQVAGIAFAAELAADIDNIDADSLFRQTEGFGKLAANSEGVFCRHRDLDASVAIDSEDCSMGFEISLVARRDMKRVLQDEVCITKPLLDVALAPGESGKAVMHIHCK